MKNYLFKLLSLCFLFNSGLSLNSSKFDGRIINGDVANQDRTFAVRIVSALSSMSQSGYLSTGVAITPNRVVTVGQAIHNFGIWYIGHGSIQVADHYESISKHATIHPEYNSLLLHNNIGIIHVVDDISRTIPIIPIAPTGFVFGYGVFNRESQLPDTLRQVSMFTIPDNTMCLHLFNQLVIRPDNICVFSEHGLTSNGDQGGPVTNTGATGVFGIVSFWSNDGAFQILVNFNEHLNFLTT